MWRVQKAQECLCGKSADCCAEQTVCDGQRLLLVSTLVETRQVNLETEPEDPSFKSDGNYVPRIFFVKDGKTLDVFNSMGNPQYRFFYTDEAQIVAAMKKAL